MTTPKHRNTSKSGYSVKSRKTARLLRKKSSSQTAPVSFAQVFGEQPSAEIQHLADLLKRAKDRLAAHKADPEPTMALYRTRYRGRLSALTANVRAIEEALEAAKDNN